MTKTSVYPHGRPVHTFPENLSARILQEKLIPSITKKIYINRVPLLLPKGIKNIIKFSGLLFKLVLILRLLLLYDLNPATTSIVTMVILQTKVRFKFFKYVFVRKIAFLRLGI